MLLFDSDDNMLNTYDTAGSVEILSRIATFVVIEFSKNKYRKLHDESARTPNM